MPEFTGGAPFSDYEVLMTNPDNSACEVYRGPEMECTVTGLLPGRPYLFQVRCLNRAGVSCFVMHFLTSFFLLRDLDVENLSFFEFINLVLIKTYLMSWTLLRSGSMSRQSS